MKNIKLAMTAVIKKDLRGITANKHMFSGLLIVPIALTIIMPSIFVFIIHFAPDAPDIQQLSELLPLSSRSENTEAALAELLLNYMLPVFFLIIPIMTASVMAASSFVGEKEKRTLETLFYCPLSVKQIFRAKVSASFILSMTVSLASFIVMLIVLETEAFFLMGSLLIPGASWIATLLIVSPSISLIAVTLIVRGSAKAQSMEESQQRAVFLVLPVVLLVVGQFTGVLLLNVWILLALGIVCAAAAFLLLKASVRRFSYETLLR